MEAEMAPQWKTLKSCEPPTQATSTATICSEVGAPAFMQGKERFSARQGESRISPCVRTGSETQTFEREPGRTADPSATLGMTKGRVTLPSMVVAKQTLGRAEGGVFVSAYSATTIDRSVTLPFIIPRACDFIDFSREVIEF